MEKDEVVCIKKKEIEKLIREFKEMEKIISTIEILSDKETMKNLKESKRDLKEGRIWVK